MFYPGCEFDFALDPSETLTIRRILTPDRVPNKGKAVYRFYALLLPFLEENGWEFIGQNQRDRAKIYLRSPGGQIAESFIIHISIPNDDAILRAVAALMKFAQGNKHILDGRLGHYSASFDFGRHYYAIQSPYRPDMRPIENPPTLYVGNPGLWSVRLDWHDGFDNPPTWDRTEYFSALVPGLTSHGELVSEMEAIYAAELKRYEESVARQSQQD
jgi:hypothetical protein